MFTLEQKVDLILRYIATTDKNQRDDLKKLVVEALNPGETTAPAHTGPDVEDLIADMLRDIGMPQHVNGYYYTVYAIKICVANHQHLNGITKTLYPEVAKEFDTTPSRVERSIRHAIELAFDRNDMRSLMSVFGNTISAINGKVTNSECIAFCTNEINRKLKKLNDAG
jgi:two-component system response regulator (stage 0 sporulation protein A)